MADGRRLLENLFQETEGKAVADQAQPGERCHRRRELKVQTLFGPIQLSRNYYYRAAKKNGRCPLDESLGLVNGYSPGVVRLACRAGGRSAFEEAAADLLSYAGLKIESREIQRLVNRLAPQLQNALDAEPPQAPAAPIPCAYVMADGTGVPMVAEELVGRQGKSPEDGPRHREVKVGCVFTQPELDETGEPWRDLDSTSYVASFETASDFGCRLYREAVRRGVLHHAQRLVFIGDGAHWIWEIAARHFSTAIQILDFYHACEHLTALAEALYGANSCASQESQSRWRDFLRGGKLDQILSEAGAQMPHHGPRRDEAESQIAYFDRNRTRLRYDLFRQQGLFIGSGVIESACRTVIGQRLKQAGMFWSLPGAQNVISIRCALKSMRFDGYWNQRNASHQLIAA